MNLRTYFDQADRGAQMRLARLVGVRAPVVSGWVRGSRPVPIAHMAAIEHFSAGAVTRQEMRPDDWQQIWPELADSEQNPAPAPAQQAPAAINVEAVGEGAHG